MALPDGIKYVDGSSYIFAYDTEWPETPTLGWSDTVNAEIDLGGLASGAYRQSAKLDLGANRDELYELMMTIEMETDPTAGERISVHAGFSDSATAATGNPAGLSGANELYTGYGGGAVADCVQQLDFIGHLRLAVMNDEDSPQVGVVGYFTAPRRYMMIVVGNGSSVAVHATADETALQVRGLTKQVQD